MLMLIVWFILRPISSVPVGLFLWFPNTKERGAKIEREPLAKNKTPDWLSFTVDIDKSKKSFNSQKLFFALRYESSTLILYKELSSPIFQSLSVSP